MSIESRLNDALLPILPGAVFPEVYQGDLPEYAVWNVTSLPQVFAERAPHAARYLVQVHYYLPHGKNPNLMKQAICRALFNAGFTWPEITPAHEDVGQHYVLEFEGVDGGGYYGEP